MAKTLKERCGAFPARLGLPELILESAYRTKNRQRGGKIKLIPGLQAWPDSSTPRYASASTACASLVSSPRRASSCTRAPLSPPSRAPAAVLNGGEELGAVSRLAVRRGQRPARARPGHESVDLARHIAALIRRHSTCGYRRLWAELRFRQGYPSTLKTIYCVLQRNGRSPTDPLVQRRTAHQALGYRSPQECRAQQPSLGA